jgi:hypothetical protein
MMQLHRGLTLTCFDVIIANDWMIPLVKAAFIGGTGLGPSSKRVGGKGESAANLKKIQT